jgi:hypothetical protein
MVYLPRSDDFTSADAEGRRHEQFKLQNGEATALDRSRGHCVMSAYLRVSEDPIVGSNQTPGALEERVGAEFERLVSSTLKGSAREVWLARSGRSVVRRFKHMKAACLAFESKRNTPVAAHIKGATDMDVDRVELMLYNAKGSLADAYDAIRNKDRGVGLHFPFKEACLWMEEQGVV